MADWFVPFEKGTLKMVGYIDGKEVCSDEVSTANAAKKSLSLRKMNLYMTVAMTQ